MAFREKLELVVDVVTGNSSGGLSKLKSELKDADGAFDKVKVAGSSMWESIQANAAQYALAAGAALAGFAVKAVGDFQETALGAGKLRDSLGITAEEASRLQEVAGDLGIGVGTLESAMGRMNRVAGSTPEVFANIGAEIKRNKDGTVNTTETFVELIGTLNGMKDPAERAAAAQQVLGRSWQDAAELIEMGADGVRAAMADVEDAKIIDDKEVEQARKFRDTLDGLKGVMESISITVGGQLVPALTDSAAAIQSLVGPITKVKDAYEEFTNLPVVNQIYKNIAPWEQWRTRIDQVSTAFEAVTGKADDMEVTFNQAASEALYLAKQQRGIEQVTDDLTGTFGGLIPTVKKAEDAERNLSSASDRLKASTQQLDAQWQALQGTLSDDAAFMSLQDQFRQTQESALLAWDAAAQGADDASAKAREYQGNVQRLKEQVVSYGQQIGLLPDQVSTYLNVIDRGDIAEMERRLAILTRNRDISVRIQSLGGAGYGALSGARADGGPVAGGKSYLVGEDGPEIFTPKGSGDIIPNGGTSGGTPVAGGSGPMHVTNNIYMPPSTNGKDLVRELRRNERYSGPRWRTGKYKAT